MNRKHINRRDFLKTIGVGSVITTAAIYGCNTKESNGDVPIGKMTYRTNRNSGDKVSILGYGCMRLPTKPKIHEDDDDVIDQDMVNKLTDYAITHGVNYFDTSPRYCQGKSEEAVGIALKKHPRNKFLVATKLSNFIDDDEAPATREASMEMYHDSFKKLQVDHLDYYLLHAIGRSIEDYQKRFINNGMLDFLIEERKAGRIRNLGFSFHGNPQVFDYALSMHNKVHWDFVQIQLNYFDWKHASKDDVNANYLYGQLKKYNIQSVIMEPLRGGRLAKIEFHLFEKLKQMRPDDSAAAWAFRYAGSYPDVLTVLSGMTYMENLQENIKTYSPLHPVTDKEKSALNDIVDGISKFPYISCTGCKYCMPCPYGLDIPGIFAQYNKCLDEGNYPTNIQDKEYRKARRAFLLGLDRAVPRQRQPQNCVNCGACLPKCPQHIEIPTEMEKIDQFTNKLKLQSTEL